MGLLPTPVHRFQAPGLPEGVQLWIKRDDLTGMQLSGNKVIRCAAEKSWSDSILLVACSRYATIG